MSTRAVSAILGDALEELRQREAQLARLTSELDQCKAAIKALRKIVPDTTRQQRALPAAAAVRQSPARAELPAGVHRDERVRLVIHEADVGCVIADVCDVTGLSVSMARDSIDRLFLDGKVRKVGQTRDRRYWSTEKLDAYVAANNGLLPDGSQG